jgi:hypothetical protein
MRFQTGVSKDEPMTVENPQAVPPHVEDTVATIAALHAAHYREAHALQLAIAKATSGIAQPVTLIVITRASPPGSR